MDSFEVGILVVSSIFAFGYLMRSCLKCLEFCYDVAIDEEEKEKEKEKDIPEYVKHLYS